MNDMIWDGANMGWFLRFGNWSVAKLLQILLIHVRLLMLDALIDWLNEVQCLKF